MEVLKGIPVSRGVVIGTVVVLEDASPLRATRGEVAPEDVPAELDRFERAREAALTDLQRVHAEARDEMGDEAAKIFLFHMGVLADKAVIEPIRRKIEQDYLTADYAVDHTIGELANKFARHTDTAFTTKVNDLHDLSSRVLEHLTGRRTTMKDAGELPDDAVVVARDLTPSQTAGFDRDKVAAMVTDLGGKTSHTAIVASALGLPAVVGCRTATAHARDGQTIVVDGQLGEVVIDPDEQTLERYRGRRKAAEARRLTLAELAETPAMTADGVPIELVGNIEFPTEVAAVLANGGEGIGLYRTEFLYLTRRDEPTEADHYEAYAACINALGGRPLTIRTMDLGADKYTQSRAEIPERNPFLGLRSIRYCLQNLPMFRTQLRAILRASALGPIKIMFPLVTTASELRQGKMILRDTMEDLADEGIDFDDDVEVGMMVEVPSAAIMATTFAREVDFFSIGTNDLVQYTLAVDRTNERVAQLYSPFHPSVVRLIRDVSRVGRRASIPVSCCGEAAGDPEYAALLIGLGLRTLSVTASSIPELKRVLAGVTIAQCERIARKVARFDSEVEAAAYTRDRIRKIVPDAYDGRTVDDA